MGIRKEKEEKGKLKILLLVKVEFREIDLILRII